MAKGLTEEQAREGARDFQREKGEEPDSTKEFKGAGHQARRPRHPEHGDRHREATEPRRCRLMHAPRARAIEQIAVARHAQHERGRRKCDHARGQRQHQGIGH